MNDIAQALAAVLEGGLQGPLDEESLRWIVADLENLGARNITDKLLEYKGALRSNRLGPLVAELRLARSISRCFGRAVQFHTGDAADIRFQIDEVDCLLEVMHKSSPHSWSAVFHPDPANRERYASGCEWQRAAHRLHTALAHVPVAIRPRVGARLIAPQVGWEARGEQQNLCGAIASWLASQLGTAAVPGELRYDDEAIFKLTPIDATPGHVLGYAPLGAWVVNEVGLRQSICNKCDKAKERLRATGADCYFVGLAIEDAFASLGHELPSALLGPLIYSENDNRTFRPVPESHRSRVDAAREHGRADSLDLAKLDRNEDNLYGNQAGFYFDPASIDLGGVFAVYYTDALQFVPNPFTTNRIDPVCRRFPATLTPVHPR